MAVAEAVDGRPAAGGSQEQPVVEPVRKTILVKASPERAFRVFAREMDTWWPKSHHIGNSPMKGIVVEPRAGGAIYTEQEDGTICPWASVIAWEPPHRFLFAWQVTADWQYEPDVTKCSDVEVLFTATDDGMTLVELEHRNLQRHGEACHKMRGQVGADGGWGTILALFAAKAGETE